MDSQTRKKNIRARLKRGDLKKLSEELDMSYSYLSQAFSPGSTFNFTDELARKVEASMGWTSGILEAVSQEERDTPRRVFFLLAIKYRAELFEKVYPNKTIQYPCLINSGSIQRKVDIAIANEDGSIYAVGLQCQDYTDDKEVAYIMLVMAMSGAKYGFLYSPSSGIGPTWEGGQKYFDGKRLSRWFKNNSGKVVEIEAGPDNVFEHVGI